jgi:hypothetical protein
VPGVTAALGALVTLTEGWQRIARYGESWIAYRTASERIKREQRLYVNGAGTYRSVEEEESYLRFVEAVEAILAEEQQIYWAKSNDPQPTAQGPKSSASGQTASHNV